MALRQQHPLVQRVLEITLPPVFTNRCCKLVRRQLSIFFRSTRRHHRFPGYGVAPDEGVYQRTILVGLIFPQEFAK
jgi:hypothetical protein